MEVFDLTTDEVPKRRKRVEDLGVIDLLEEPNLKQRANLLFDLVEVDVIRRPEPQKKNPVVIAIDLSQEEVVHKVEKSYKSTKSAPPVVTIPDSPPSVTRRLTAVTNAAAMHQPPSSSSSSSMQPPVPSEQTTKRPVKVITLDLDLTGTDQVQCLLCFDTIHTNAACTCANKHYVCVDCLENFIKSAYAPGAMNSTDNDGRLLCFNCKSPYDPTEFTTGNRRQLFEQLQDLRITKVKEREVKLELQKQEERLRKEFDATLAKGGDERDAHRLAQKIRDEVLNLRCPGCKAVFLDFDGCFALKCAVNSCRKGFCAWCLMNCGADAHAHVNTCPEGKGIYGTLDVFNKHHQKRRQKTIEELLQGENVAVQKSVLDALKKELADLGIKITARAIAKK